MHKVRGCTFLTVLFTIFVLSSGFRSFPLIDTIIVDGSKYYTFFTITVRETKLRTVFEAVNE